MRQQSQPQKRREPLMPLEGEADLKADALLFHSAPRPGKLEISATKPLANQRDLALAYSPGVAFPCLAIAADPHKVAAVLSPCTVKPWRRITPPPRNPTPETT